MEKFLSSLYLRQLERIKRIDAKILQNGRKSPKIYLKHCPNEYSASANILVGKNCIHGYMIKIGINLNYDLLEIANSAKIYLDNRLISFSKKGLSQTTFCSELILMFNFYHEYAHVVRGHLRYLNSIRPEGKVNSIITEGNETLSVNNGDPKMCYEIFKLECDADMSAGRFMWGTVLDIIKSCGQNCDEEMTLDIISLTSFAVGSLFLHFESIRPEADPSYPRSFVRSIIVQTALRDTIKERISQIDELNHLKGLTSNAIHDSIQKGLNMCVEFRNTYKKITLNYDPVAASEEWNSTHRKNVESNLDLLREYFYI